MLKSILKILHKYAMFYKGVIVMSLKVKIIIATLLSLLSIYLFITNLPLLTIICIAIYIIQKKYGFNVPEESKPQVKHIPEKPRLDYSVVQATLEECQSLLDERQMIINETDLRQFEGRDDVTKEELAQYMFEQRYWDGAYERRLQMEEIAKHCNLTEEDVNWCVEELKHYKLGGQVYRAYAVRNEEAKAIWEETNRENAISIKNTIKEIKTDYENIKKFEQGIGITKYSGYKDYEEYFNKRHNETITDLQESLRRYDYEGYLKMEGYIK
jgi:hypothetical protein